MNVRQLSLAALIALTLGAAGCSSSTTNTQIGTGGGAVAGGLIGDALFDSTAGTVGGAAAGALIGNQIGKRNDDR